MRFGNGTPTAPDNYLENLQLDQSSAKHSLKTIEISNIYVNLTGITPFSWLMFINTRQSRQTHSKIWLLSSWEDPCSAEEGRASKNLDAKFRNLNRNINDPRLIMFCELCTRKDQQTVAMLDQKYLVLLVKSCRLHYQDTRLALYISWMIRRTHVF